MFDHDPADDAPPTGGFRCDLHWWQSPDESCPHCFRLEVLERLTRTALDDMLTRFTQQTTQEIRR